MNYQGESVLKFSTVGGKGALQPNKRTSLGIRSTCPVTVPFQTPVYVEVPIYLPLNWELKVTVSLNGNNTAFSGNIVAIVRVLHDGIKVRVYFSTNKVLSNSLSNAKLWGSFRCCTGSAVGSADGNNPDVVGISIKYPLMWLKDPSSCQVFLKMAYF